MRVNIVRRVKTAKGWANVALKRNVRGRIQWPSRGPYLIEPYLIEWRANGRRLREAAVDTPADALEAQKRKRLELEAKETGLEVSDPDEEKKLPLSKAVEDFLKEIATFRKPLTHQKYETILELFTEYAAPSPMPGISLPRT